MKLKIKKSEYQDIADCILMEQVSAPEIVELFEDKGFFTFRDSTEEILFSLINAKKPGNFLEEKTSSDIALVLDPSKTPKVVESFDLMFSVAKSLSEDFSCSLLDENRNLLTKQMLEHMRDESQEFQRQRLANVS